ncbi:MAG: hypothetical protein ACOH1H_11145 [Brevundimonas sp.]
MIEIVLIGASLSIVGAISHQSLAYPSRTNLNLIGQEWCIGNEGPVSIDSFFEIDSRRIVFDSEDQSVRYEYELASQSVIFKLFKNQKIEEGLINIRNLIDNGHDLDIRLSFMVSEGGYYLHWRETYENRIYRMGLFKLVASEMVPLCNGSGGVQADGH